MRAVVFNGTKAGSINRPTWVTVGVSGTCVYCLCVHCESRNEFQSAEYPNRYEVERGLGNFFNFHRHCVAKPKTTLKDGTRKTMQTKPVANPVTYIRKMGATNDNATTPDRKRESAGDSDG